MFYIPIIVKELSRRYFFTVVNAIPLYLAENNFYTPYLISMVNLLLTVFNFCFTIFFWQAHVDPIIFPDSRMNPTEDLSWSDDEDDVRVENMVKMAEEGKAFSKEMFGGGCIPSEIVVAAKKPKRGGKSRVVRSMKAPSNGRNSAGLRRKQKSPGIEDGERSDCVDVDVLSRMIDDKLKAQAERLIKGVINCFSENLVVDTGTSKASASVGNGTKSNIEGADVEENSNHVSNPKSNNETAGKDHNAYPPPSQPVPLESDFNLRFFKGDQAISAVDNVVYFYNLAVV